MEARMAEMQEQVTTLHDWWSHSMQADTLTKGPTDKLKIANLSDQDDIEAYLVTFERLMEAYEISKQCWAFKLVPQLSGHAQQACSSMPSEQCGDYSEVKVAILHHYDITKETYR